MTAHARLVQLQRSLATALVARGLLIGATVAAGLIALARTIGTPGWSIAIAVLAGTGTAAVLLIPLRILRSLSHVALWVEERTPSLR